MASPDTDSAHVHTSDSFSTLPLSLDFDGFIQGGRASPSIQELSSLIGPAARNLARSISRRGSTFRSFSETNQRRTRPEPSGIFLTGPTFRHRGVKTGGNGSKTPLLLSEESADYIIPISYQKWPKIAEGKDRVVVRSSIIGELESFLVQDRDFRQRRIAILEGPSGYGKTQVAISFATSHSSCFTSMFYINANSKETTESSLSAALDDIWGQWDGRPAIKTSDTAEIVSTVRQWFSKPNNHKWLLILDDVSKPDNREYDIRNYISSNSNGGTILITTKFGESYGLQQGQGKCRFPFVNSTTLRHFPIRGLEPGEGYDLLSLQGFGLVHEDERSMADTLLRRLDYSPMAIVQFCKDYGDKSLGREFQSILKGIVNNTQTLGETDEIKRLACQAVLNRLLDSNNELERAAGRLALVCTHLDRQDIWIELLRRGVAHPNMPCWFQTLFQDEANLRRATDILIERSLLTTDEDHISFTMNEKVRHYLSVSPARHDKDFLRIAICCVALSACSVYHPRLCAIRRRMLPHLQALIQSLRDYLASVTGDKDLHLPGFRIDDQTPEWRQVILEILQDDEDKGKVLDYVSPMEILLEHYLAAELAGNPEEAEALVKDVYSLWKTSVLSSLDVVGVGLLLGALYHRRKMFSACSEMVEELLPLAAGYSKYHLQVRILDASSRMECKSKAGQDRSESEQVARQLEEDARQLPPILQLSTWILSDIASLYGDLGNVDREQHLREELLNKRIRLTDITESDPNRGIKGVPLPVWAEAANLGKLIRPEAKGQGDSSYYLHTMAWEGLRQFLPAGHQYFLRQGEILASICQETGRTQLCIGIRTELHKAYFWGSVRAEPQTMINNFLLLVEARNTFAKDLMSASEKEDNDNSLTQARKTRAEAGEVVVRHNYLTRDMRFASPLCDMAILLDKAGDYELAREIVEDVLAYLKDTCENSNGVLVADRDELNRLAADSAVPCRTYAGALLIMIKTYVDHGQTANAEAMLNELCGVSAAPGDIDGRSVILRHQIDGCIACSDYQRALTAMQTLRSIKPADTAASADEVGDLELEVNICTAIFKSRRTRDSIRAFGEVIEALDARIDSHGSGEIASAPWLQRASRSPGEPTEHQEGSHYSHSLRKVKYRAMHCMGLALSSETDQTGPDMDRAYMLFSQCLTYYEGRDSDNELEVLLNMLEQWSRWSHEQTIPLMERAWRILDMNIIPRHRRRPLQFKILTLQGLGCRNEGNLEGAQCLWEEALKLAREDEPLDDDKVLEVEKLLRACYWELHKHSEALDLVAQRSHTALDALFSTSPELSLQHIYELSLVVAASDPHAALGIILSVLERCESQYGNADSRTRAIFRILEVIEDIRSPQSREGYTVFITRDGDLSLRTPNQGVVHLTQPPADEPCDSESEWLCQHKWQIALLCGKVDLVLNQLQDPHLRDYLEYNPPSRHSIWPRSWTFRPNRLQKLPRGDMSVPLWIAGCPVVIPAPCCNAIVSTAFKPVEDIADTIDPSAPLSDADAIRIFTVFDFARGFCLLLSGILQIIVDDDFDLSDAVINRPPVYGRLDVEYVRMGLNLTSNHQEDKGISSASSGNVKGVLKSDSRGGNGAIRNDSILKLKLRGRRNNKNDNRCRIGLRIRVRTDSRAADGQDYLTVSSHSLWEVAHRPGWYREWFARLPHRKKLPWYKKVEASDSNGNLVGIGAKSFDSPSLTNPHRYPEALQHDVSLVQPVNDQVAGGVESPLANLGWISRDAWMDLQRSAKDAKLYLLDHDTTAESKRPTAVGIRNDGHRDPGRCVSDAVVIGQGCMNIRARSEGRPQRPESLVSGLRPVGQPLKDEVAALCTPTKLEGREGLKKEVLL